MGNGQWETENGKQNWETGNRKWETENGKQKWETKMGNTLGIKGSSISFEGHLATSPGAGNSLNGWTEARWGVGVG